MEFLPTKTFSEIYYRMSTYKKHFLKSIMDEFWQIKSINKTFFEIYNYGLPIKKTFSEIYCGVSTNKIFSEIYCEVSNKKIFSEIDCEVSTNKIFSEIYCGVSTNKKNIWNL